MSDRRFDDRAQTVSGATMCRRRLGKALLGAALAAASPAAPAEAALGQSWTHLVGTGDSILFYNGRTRQGRSGQLTGEGI